MKFSLNRISFVVLFLIGIIPQMQASSPIQVEMPDLVIDGVESTILLKAENEKEYRDSLLYTLTLNSERKMVYFEDGKAVLKADISQFDSVKLKGPGLEHSSEVKTLPLWLSIIPPLIAIFMALFFREVITSLLTGILAGSLTIHIYLAGFMGVPKGFFAIIDTFIIDALADADHLSVIVFSLLIGGMVSLISRNGGMQGVVNHISKLAKTPRSGQIATWILGVAIFFDDYANTLVVGNTMRPVTDRLKISREKLSYIVDSTAAPIAAVAFVTTWIGAELGYIKDGIDTLDLGAEHSPYSIFIDSLAYSFYPLLTLAFMLILFWLNKDYGPMYKAEVRARTTGKVSSRSVDLEMTREEEQELDNLQSNKTAKPRAFNAIIPVVVVIFGTLAGLLITGWSDETWSDPEMGFARKLSSTIGASNSYAALLWASLGGVITALLLTVGQRMMNLEHSIEAVLDGFKSMLHAMIILILAWALADVTTELHTADFITSGLEKGGVPPVLLPAITFLLAGLVAFSTGSSWGTMAILYPLMIPAAWIISQKAGMDNAESMDILANAVSCVLAGSVLGDHCSPISDTTILSSLASDCNHIDHVRTQLPYALTVGAVSVVIGTIPGAFGVPFWISFPAGLLVLYAVVRFVGKEVPGIGE